MDGWVSWKFRLCSRHDTPSTLAAAKDLHARAGRPNLFIKIPGTKEGLPAIEEAIFAGVPINVTLLFSREQYVAAAEAYLRGVERRIDAGLKPDVGSVASLFISRWDVAVAGKVPDALATSSASPSPSARTRRMRASSRPAGSALSTPARVLNGCCSPAREPKTLGVRYPLHQGPGRAVHGQYHAGGHFESVRRSWRGGRDAAARTGRLRGGVGAVRQGRHRHRRSGGQASGRGAESFVKSWNELMGVIASKSAVLEKAVTPMRGAR